MQMTSSYNSLMYSVSFSRPWRFRLKPTRDCSMRAPTFTPWRNSLMRMVWLACCSRNSRPASFWPSVMGAHVIGRRLRRMGPLAATRVAVVSATSRAASRSKRSAPLVRVRA